MTPPADSPERDQALASIARHGALGAAVIDLNATRAELADAIQSLVASVLATVAATQERDRLRRVIEAIRVLHRTVTGVGCHHCGREWPCPTIRALDADGADASGSHREGPSEPRGAIPGTSGHRVDSVPANPRSSQTEGERS